MVILFFAMQVQLPIIWNYQLSTKFSSR